MEGLNTNTPIKSESSVAQSVSVSASASQSVSPSAGTVRSISKNSIKSKSSKRRKERSYVVKNPKKKKGCLSQLVQGILVYGLCVSLPTVFGVLLHLYESRYGHDGNVTDGAQGVGVNGRLGNNGFGDIEYGTIFSSPSTVRQESIATLAKHTADVLWSPYSNARETIHLLELPTAIYHFLQRHLGLYIKRHALSDVQYIVAASFLLSLVRVILVFMLVPRYLAPRRLAAFVHSKSAHLLSKAEYQIAENEFGSDDDKRNSSVGDYLSNIWIQTGHSLRRSLGHEAESSYLNMDAKQARRLFSAPRYATAIFRLLFCLLSCAWGLLNFSSANFWPVWVGGHKTAQTKNCWDLSGSVALKGASLDSDFDHQNSALRYFFLGQASYQIHSLCFHFLSMALLIIYGGNEGYLSARQSLKSYFRPMLEHSLYFVLTVATYVFSGLRRLGAITIFSLEMSSMILQILQICINAPEKSILRNETLVKFLHRFVVIPVFVYCRFFVMPFVVQYSAVFESSMWLQQIEHALKPGVGMAIYVFFNGMLLSAFGLNFIYLRRLLFHPFILRINKAQRNRKKQD